MNNIIRTTIQALAAVLGGTQSLHTNSYDEALGLPTEDSALLALRTQQVIAHESGVAASVDPLGGSYLIEQWTNRLETEVRKHLDRVDAMGGMLKAIEHGYPQQCIERSAFDYQQSVESKARIVVGVNEFTAEEAAPKNILSVPPELERRQCKRLAAFRKKRAAGPAREVLDRVRTAAQSSENLMPVIVDAIRAGATLGEISDALRGVFGEYRQQESPNA